MTLVRFNHPSLMSQLANEAIYGNLFDSNLGAHADCSNEQVNYRVNEEEAVVNLEFAIPGLSKSDIEIELKNDILTVKTKKRDENDVRSGFASAQFEKNFKLTNKVNKEQISAHSENGVLYVTLPKVDEHVKKPARAIKIS